MELFIEEFKLKDALNEILVISLPLAEKNNNTLFIECPDSVDIIKNDHAEMPDEIFNSKDELKRQLISLLNVLDDREKVIVEDYYGLSGTPRTLEDIGGDFNLTKERVRQIKEKALRKLRNDSSILYEYM